MPSIRPHHLEHGIRPDFEIIAAAPGAHDRARQRGLVDAVLDQGLVDVNGDDLAKQMNATAAHVARDVSEFAIAGLTAVPCKLVNAPRVAESPVSFECKLSQIIQLQGANGEKAQAWLTLGEVVAVHIDKAMIKDGVYQTALAHPIVRAGRRGDYFEIRPDAMFEMVRPD